MIKRILFLLTVCLLLHLNLLSQKVYLSVMNMPLEAVLHNIDKQTGYSIVWNKTAFSHHAAFSGSFPALPLADALKRVLLPFGLTFHIAGKIIVIGKLEWSLPGNAATSPARESVFNVAGQIRDVAGKPVASASVYIGAIIGSLSDERGGFLLQGRWPGRQAAITVSCQGYVTKSVLTYKSPSIELLLQCRLGGQLYNQTLQQVDDSKIGYNADDTLLPSSALYNAGFFATVKNDETLMYFGSGSGIWSIDLAAKAEKLLYSLPQEEKLVLLKHVKYVPNAYDPSPYAHNYIAVGSVVQGSYKVRFFTKNNSLFSASPVFTLEGKGRVSNLLFVAPTINDLIPDRNYYFKKILPLFLLL